MKEVSGTTAAISVHLLAEHLVCQSLFVVYLKKKKKTTKKWGEKKKEKKLMRQKQEIFVRKAT